MKTPDWQTNFCDLAFNSKKMKLQSNIISTITQKQVYSQSFNDIVKNFDKKLADFSPSNHAVSIRKYFSSGIATSRTLLLKDNVIKESWLRKYKTKRGRTKYDFKGLYIFYHKQIPIYVGISKGVCGRILQHVKGKTHNTSTLAFNIGLIIHEIQKGEKYIGTRDDFDYVANVTPAKNFLFDQKIAFIPIETNEELYTFEVYCAMNFQCWLNKFETH